jgi:curved DNA-binding protein
VAEAAERDLYAILGVARDADAETIRKTYRQLARRLHPDVNPGDAAAEERFKAVSEAYAVLSEPEKRRLYDEFGEISLQSGFDPEAARRAREAFGARFGGASAGGFEFGGGAGEGFAYGDLDDLLSQLFERRGWSGGAPAARRGPDVEAELELDLVDAARGGERRLTIGRPTAEGGVRSETVTVRIPSGVSDGGRIRLPGKGGEGRGGGPPGDLHARIRVRPHPVFRREGRDLFVDLPLTVREAVLGAKVEVPTLDGHATVTVPPGTDSGTRLRLRGKGVPHPSGGKVGDLYAVTQIRVPRDLDPEARARIEAMTELDPPDRDRGKR